MIKKRVSTFYNIINILARRGEQDPEITGLAYDSREVAPGNLFFALEGLHTDGHRYIDQAVENGAAAVIHSQPLSRYHSSVVYLQTENTRTAISAVAAAFFDRPSEKLTVIGVTGTDGKSTTVYLIHQLLENMGYRSGFFSTVHYQDADRIRKNTLRQSTPEAIEIHQLLSRMVLHEKNYAVLEATSHGLSPRNNRLGDVDFDVAVFTNLSHEHLEFHGSLEQYRDDKANLFRKACRFAVINRDDDHYRFFRDASSGIPVFSYSVQDRNSDLSAYSLHYHLDGTDALISTGDRPFRSYIPFPGAFNTENILAAVLTVSKVVGKHPEDVAAVVPDLQPVPGRMNRVDEGQPFRVIVDYAHTPGSFSKLFPFVREHTGGRIIALFGSAGERDVEKRAQQGAIADDYADIIVLTDEDPRGEDPRRILEDISAGCRTHTEGNDLHLIKDRREAIERALLMAQPGDTVILLGKGHEESILYAHSSIDWNEYQVARDLLRDMGFRRETGGRPRSS